MSDQTSKNKTLIVEDMQKETTLGSKERGKHSDAADPSAAFEIFRNNATSVEVIVKQVPHKCGKHAKSDKPHNTEMSEKSDLSTPTTLINKQDEDIDNLKIELNRANFKLISSRKTSYILLHELKRQLELAMQKEMSGESKILTLQLENEKLKAMLECKTNIISRLRKELEMLKKFMKFAIKSLNFKPEPTGRTATESYMFSDPEYFDFEQGLKKQGECLLKSVFNGANITLDSSNMTKEQNLTGNN